MVGYEELHPGRSNELAGHGARSCPSRGGRRGHNHVREAAHGHYSLTRDLLRSAESSSKGRLGQNRVNPTSNNSGDCSIAVTEHWPTVSSMFDGSTDALTAEITALGALMTSLNTVTVTKPRPRRSANRSTPICTRFV